MKRVASVTNTLNREVCLTYDGKPYTWEIGETKPTVALDAAMFLSHRQPGLRVADERTVQVLPGADQVAVASVVVRALNKDLHAKVDGVAYDLPKGQPVSVSSMVAVELGRRFNITPEEEDRELSIEGEGVDPGILDLPTSKVVTAAAALPLEDLRKLRELEAVGKNRKTLLKRLEALSRKIASEKL